MIDMGLKTAYKSHCKFSDVLKQWSLLGERNQLTDVQQLVLLLCEDLSPRISLQKTAAVTWLEGRQKKR